MSGCKSEEDKIQIDSKPPNILFIMSDDHAYQAISAYDDRLIQTPNIDRIAREGMLFTNASVTNSICAPSRAVILTGKHSHINGKIDNISPFDTTNVTFPQLFREAGYQTAMFGKLHFGNNPKGVDEFMILPGQGRYYNPKFITKEGDTIIKGYVTDIITDQTLKWLKEKRNPEKPFLLMYFHKAPHRSWLPAPRHYREFTQKKFPLPSSLFDDYKRVHDSNISDSIPKYSTAAKDAEMSILAHMTLGYDNKVNLQTLNQLGVKEDFMNWPPTSNMDEQQSTIWDSIYNPISADFLERYNQMSTEELMEWKYQRYMQDYLGCIAGVDENVGRVLDYIEDSGLEDKTVVVYTSDQGFYLGEHGWFDKRFMYNESFKTPLLIKWPNVITPNTTQEEMVQNLDFAQTFLEMAGIVAPEDMQGESIVPLLKGENHLWKRDAIYYHYYEYPGVHMVKRHYGIANKRYKLMHFYYDIDEWELYDLEKDPQELNNEYYNPEYSEIVGELKTKLKELRLKYKDSDSLNQKFINQYSEEP
nr:sulfatase [Aegicerativicinus sediminis]